MLIYHDPCTDGFCCAWLYNKFYDDVLVPAKYGDAPPDVTDQKVVIADFSYSRDVLLDMCDKALSVTVLDHHKTAKANLEDLFHDKLYVKFDMEKSGAQLMLEWLKNKGHPVSRYTAFVNLIADRDLWTWNLPRSREFSAGLSMVPLTIEAWDDCIADADCHDTLKSNGELILRYKDTVIAAHKPGRKTIDGYDVPFVNATTLISEIGEKLCDGEPFACMWFMRADGKFVYSLRSRGEFDVSAIAVKFGGGGHRNAAGFTLEELL